MKRNPYPAGGTHAAVFEATPVAFPEALAGVVLLDLADLMRAYSASRSWVYAMVAAGKLPQPVRLGRRFTRWRASDVAVHLQEMAAADDRGNAGLMNAKRASLAGLASAAKRAKEGAR